ncbi:MAG: 3-oxoacyl-ACP reductase FabG [Myxococcota bacterium]|nr:3-oxoacyl-ACP reductase FabG [Myxococcota bacterium]
MRNLAGKVALVSGGSRGIGKAIVERLVAEGCKVLFTFHSAQAEAEGLVERLSREGGAVVCTRAAVERLEDCRAAVQRTLEALGGLHILVNNAGRIRDGSFLTMPEEAWREVIEVELVGTINLTQPAVKELRRANGASVINIGSIAGDVGNAGQANHSAAKAGVVGFTRALAQELGPLGVRVNCVSPGVIETEIWKDVPQEKRARYVSRTPLRRIGTPADIAGTVAFLASDDASFITGQVLSVNGGLLAPG